MQQYFSWISGPTIGKQLRGTRQMVPNHRSIHIILRSLNSVPIQRQFAWAPSVKPTSVDLIGRLPYCPFEYD